MAKVAFIGLGVMGFPMAGHLATQGHEVTVFNRNPARAEAWLQQYRGRSATTPAAAAEGAEFVFTCIGNDNDLFQVILEQGGLLDGMKPGAVLIDHTTASADAARKIHEAAAQRGIHFLDAPVSGGQAGAENGKLTVMVGGDADAFARAEPVIGVFARAVTLMGPAGAGQLTKMVNQICIAGLVQALSEGLAFAENAGLDAALVVDVISKGASQSWQLENRGKTMIERKFDFGFAVDWMRKDLGICIAEAKRNGSQLPVTELTDQFYSEVQQAGGGRFDTSSLITRLGKK
ncbi:NAD(P)-dependent oxidoreductase [Janthinobacterium agaricidamnosum]|uniref:NAD(P)-dependent oxidoreductase n=1 Tax=Janthinobacterium agaricidamnosum TaxID=55508 RepID=UPI00056E1A54|nr:NAD(P)-dependent oxidoreductase [Janthinobacterium agaricidamnosum]